MMTGYTPAHTARLTLSLALFLVFAATLRAQTTRRVEFNRDIRPILSDACFQCHGPDQARRKADLRLDTEDGIRADLGGHRAVVPGRPDESALLRRVTSNNPRRRMPPASMGPALPPEKVQLLRDWIAQGAAWEKHWSFIPPRRPPLPRVRDHHWPRNAIDHFVLARLEREGLHPAPEADRITLLRRVALDLTGLPPTPEEVDAVLADRVPGAYERYVDRLLASPRHGERLAQRWLDAARYADTNGYQTDGERTMWRWRDWVIEAFNANMPFDRFTITQIAGDMLPGATLDQKIATGFNRNHRGNSEGGVIPEEYAVEYVVDRVDTTATVWLGLTAGCAKCHSHKYDPLTQKEFYRLFAYFNNVPEKGKAIKYGNSPPYLKAPTRAQQRRLRLLREQLAAAEDRWRRMQPQLDRAQRQWERSLDLTRPLDWSLTRGQVAHFPLDTLNVPAVNGAGPGLRAVAGRPARGPGRVGRAAIFDGRGHLEAGDIAKFGFFDKFSISVWVRTAADDAGTLLSRMTDTDRADGYALAVRGGKLHVLLVKRWLDDSIRVETVESLRPGRWHHVLVSYDGSRVAAGVKVFLDGRPAKLKINLDDLNQNFVTDEPLRIGGGGGQTARFRGALDEIRIYDHVLPDADAAMLANTDGIHEIVAIHPDKRDAAQRHKLRSYYVELQASADIRAAHRAVQTAAKELEAFDATIPTTMVMQEIPTPRATHVLLRGEYDRKGERVDPGLPAALPPLPKGAPNNRLGFARWLVARDNPLTARVTVNRHWQMLFGAGIVRTVEDFGAQGDWPSHPELLDWLAVEFMESGWDVKRLLRTIVTSATYRQSSRLTPELLRRDPENRLLARGPRYRLAGGMIRDQALLVSGLLVERLGGPSVRPYQPPGLIKELHGGPDDYVQDHGSDLYRRSLYTFWKRTVAPPMLMTFDAANRETCVVREARTNTPLQALNLLNDVTFIEAARVMAQRVLREAGPSPEARLERAFRLAALRRPSTRELAVLRAGLERHRATFAHDRAAAAKLVQAGEAPRPHDVDIDELAAYTAVCNLILNLDEVITKE